MLKGLNEKKNELIERAEKVLDKAKSEERELTEEESSQLKEIRDNVQKIIDTLNLNDEFRKLDNMTKKNDETPTNEGKTTENERAIKELNEEKAFENFVRGFVVHERAGELTKADNGSVIPSSIANKIIKKVYDLCPILEKSSQFNVKGKIVLPCYLNGENKINVAYQDEFTQLNSTSGKFSTIELNGFLAGCLTKISRSLINNSEFNIVDFIVSEMATAIKLFIEHELLIGTEGKVTGLSTLQNKISAESSNAITADEVVRLRDAIKDQYQGSAFWVMSSKTRTALRLLKAENGTYLFNDDVTAPFGTALLGKPVYVSDNMPEIGSGKTVIYYGDMTGLGTKFSEKISIDILREKFADEHAVGVVGWFEFDSKVIDEQKIAKLVMAD